MTFPPSVRVTSGPCSADEIGEMEVTGDVMDISEIIIANDCHYELIFATCGALGKSFT